MTDELIHALPVGTRVSDYQIESILGEGGFGITYLATDVNLDVKVAVKEYFPGGLAARDATYTVLPYSGTRNENYALGLKTFIREAKLLAKLEHPNIVPVRRYLEKNGTAYIVMTYVQGVTLQKKLEQIGRMTQEEIRAVFLPLIDGLKMAHELGVLHRDIKPENILISDLGRPVLIDFGAAKQQTGEQTKSQTTFQTVTDGFSPPEQYSTSAKIGPYSDIYALAVSMYYAITLEKVSTSTDRMMDETVIPLSQKLGDASGFDNTLLETIDQGMAIRFSERQQSMQELEKGVISTSASQSRFHNGKIPSESKPGSEEQEQEERTESLENKVLTEDETEAAEREGQTASQPEQDGRTVSDYFAYGFILLPLILIMGSVLIGILFYIFSD